MQKTLRILGVSLALIALLVFATGVVSDWNHQGANDDARCPYCHLGHQTPAQLVVAPSVSLSEAGRFLAAAARRSFSHGPCFFADLASRASLCLISSPQRFLLLGAIRI